MYNPKLFIFDAICFWDNSPYSINLGVVSNAMRQSLLIIILLLFVPALFSQSGHRNNKSTKQDTSFISVVLRDIHFDKTLIIEVGEKARIYVSGDSIKNEATSFLTNDFVRDEYTPIIKFLDSSYKEVDTVAVAFYKFINLQYLVSRQLKNGYAKVFYKRQNAFVDTIFHRRERYGGHGDRFFYLPDKRPFFGVIEITGIIDNDAFFSGKYYDDYVKEGEKLGSLRLK
jgi:hypothetical protein